jgi:hypothetical protein
MFVPSEVALTLKRGIGENFNRIFVNKARVGEGVENTPDGMAKLADALEAGNVTDCTMNLIGIGVVAIEKVVEGLRSGSLTAWQYHRDGYAEPKWQIQLGFAKEVKTKNAGYAAKKPGGKKKSKKTSAQKSKPRGLLS